MISPFWTIPFNQKQTSIYNSHGYVLQEG
uniref:Uncharacterized protein n=1 Tax=Rhizophora mucronata TaxID=61149 RepID=A0A2P2JDV8_RHIMU